MLLAIDAKNLLTEIIIFYQRIVRIMMEPKKISVSGLFEMNVQYKIPLFQRYYVWNEDTQWGPLWDDIVRQHNSHAQGKSPDHFYRCYRHSAAEHTRW